MHLLPTRPESWLIEPLTRLKVQQAKVGAGAAWVLIQLRNGDRCLGLAREFRWIGGANSTIEMTLEKTVYQVADSEKREHVGRVLLRSDDILWFSPYRTED